MIRNTCGKFQSNISSGYLENKPLHANLNLGCDADAGGSTIALLIYKYIVELKMLTHRHVWLRNIEILSRYCKPINEIPQPFYIV